MSIGYKLFPSLAAERDRLVAELERQIAQNSDLDKRRSSLFEYVQSLLDQLAATTLRATSAEAKLAQMHRPGPLEPTTIKVGTAADVRRIVEQQNFRDEQENSDGIR